MSRSALAMARVSVLSDWLLRIGWKGLGAVMSINRVGQR
jgi:hypothetical protein